MTKIKTIAEKESTSWPSTVIVDLPKPFVDDRGSIQPLVDIEMKSSVLITSNPGSIRANHYHKSDWHYCYILFGELKYFYRPHGNNKKPEEIIIREKQMFFTPPMIEHAMVFTQRTHFLTWSRNSRLQEIYEADVCRIPPINNLK